MKENVRLAFKGIWSHKMRSFLTMLGIIIGIAAIIAIVSTIKGNSEEIRKNLIGSGNNTVEVRLTRGGMAWSVDSYGSDKISIPVVASETLDEIREIPEVEDASAFLYREVYDGIFYGNQAISSVMVYGVDDEYFRTCGFMIKSGRGFTDRDNEKYRTNVILDNVAAVNMFGQTNPLGKVIEISSVPFTVVGVVTIKSTFEPTIKSIEDYYSYNQDDSNGLFFIPKATWPVIYNYDEPESVVVKAVNTDAMTKAGQKTERILNSRLEDTTSSDAVKYRAKDLTATATNSALLATSTQRQLLWIAGISLLVGGIGVMNIMLVSVTERTGEIGLKKALGAKKKRILIQFLTESAMLTSMGGVIGVIAGIVLARIISVVTGTPSAISVPAIVLGVLFSMAVGVIFGLLPSFKAANLNPIDALRRE